MAVGKKLRDKCGACLQGISNRIVSGLEEAFYRLGLLIGNHPWKVILMSSVLALLFAPGVLLFFHEETNLNKLWVPPDSRASTDKGRVDSWFPTGYRRENLIVEAENVLEPVILRAMLDIDQEIKKISGRDYSWGLNCERRGSECWSNSLLELWSFNRTVIDALTKQDILDTVNNVTKSPVYFNVYKVSLVLGGVTYDSSGQISGARATSMLYVLHTDNIDANSRDEECEAWEEDFLDISELGHPDIPRLYRTAVKSFVDESEAATDGDFKILSIGYVIVLTYVIVVLGKFNRLQQRVYLSLVGVLCVGLAIMVSIGLCSYAQLSFTLVHKALPFLMIGIGVDDMFVIVQAWDTLPTKHSGLPIREKIALTMKDAGVSITVTSLTDVLAFAIGASTVIPAFRSFCIYAAVGILALFFLQSTLFVAVFTLNQTREAELRDACCCCFVRYDSFKPSSCSQRSFIQEAFDRVLAPAVTYLPIKVGLTVFTVGLFAGCVYGVSKLENEFDRVWHLPDESYAREYIRASNKYFPSDRLSTAVYIGDIDYYDEYTTLEGLYQAVYVEDFTNPGTVDAWFVSYKDWLQTASDADSAVHPGTRWPTTEDNFYNMLQVYLRADEGMRFTDDVLFTDDVPKRIKASRMTLKHTKLSCTADKINAMEGLREAVEGSGLTDKQAFAYTPDYIATERDKIIQKELYTNISLAFASVFWMMLVLIANLWTCILVTICVIVTLVDLGGMVYFWGLTINTVTAVNLIAAVGFSVDYSSHIGRMFMTQLGNRNERVRKTLHHIGPAVFNGGFSTFLAFVLLGFSVSYIFQVFFKVYVFVVAFGLFHGLVFLPVLLSWFGPPPYMSAEEEGEEAKKTKNTPVFSPGDAERNGQGPELDGTHVPSAYKVDSSEEKPKEVYDTKYKVDTPEARTKEGYDNRAVDLAEEAVDVNL